MKRQKKSKIILLISIIIIILLIASKIFISNKNQKNVATLQKGKELLAYNNQKWVNLKKYEDVNMIYLRGGTSPSVSKIDTSNAGWCLAKGKALYGLYYTYSNGDSTIRDSVITEVLDAYSWNNAKTSYAGSIRWLMDNMVRYPGNTTENKYYRENLESVLGISLKNYSNEDIFMYEQYVLWQLTNNASGATLPTSNNAFYTKLLEKAKENNKYSSSGKLNKSSKLKISKASGFTVTNEGWVGPITISGNNSQTNISSSISGYSGGYTLYKSKNASNTNKISDFKSYNGDFYIKLNGTFNVNTKYEMKFSVTKYGYTTTGHAFKTKQSVDSYAPQPFLMIERSSDKVTKNVEFEYEKNEPIDGEYSLYFAKKSTETLKNDTENNSYSRFFSRTCIGDTRFNYTKSYIKEDGSEFSQSATYQKSLEAGKWTKIITQKIYNTDGNKYDKYRIKEYSCPNEYIINPFEYELHVYKKIDKANNKKVLDYVKIYYYTYNDTEHPVEITTINKGSFLNIDKSNDFRIVVSVNDSGDIFFGIVNEPKEGKYSIKIAKKSILSETGNTSASDAIGGATFTVNKKIYTGSDDAYEEYANYVTSKDKDWINLGNVEIKDLNNPDEYIIEENIPPEGYTSKYSTEDGKSRKHKYKILVYKCIADYHDILAVDRVEIYYGNEYRNTQWTLIKEISLRQ